MKQPSSLAHLIPATFLTSLDYSQAVEYVECAKNNNEVFCYSLAKEICTKLREMNPESEQTFNTFIENENIDDVVNVANSLTYQTCMLE